jgi:DNA-damage-inducible protein J
VSQLQRGNCRLGRIGYERFGTDSDRQDEAVKEEAAAVLASMGLTVSDAVRLMLTKIAKEHALPFEPLAPNELTVHAMKEARRGKLQPFEDVDALMADLNADD